MVSEINPFFLGPGSVACCPITAEAEVVPDFLDFFPIWSKIATGENSAQEKNERNAENRWRKPSMEELCQSMNNGRFIIRLPRIQSLKGFRHNCSINWPFKPANHLNAHYILYLPNNRLSVDLIFWRLDASESLLGR